MVYLSSKQKETKSPVVKICAWLLMVFVVWVLCLPDQKQKSDKANHPGGQEVAQKDSAKHLDISSQKQFESSLLNYAITYKSQPNEIKKSGVYNKAINWEQGYLKEASFSGWHGVIKDISTPKGGESAIVVIKSCISIPKKYTEPQTTPMGEMVEVRAQMFNDDFFCLSYGTEINSKEPIYAQVGELQIGTKITFNGEFESGEEKSFTEDGAMTAPEFKINLISVKKVK